jgi:hypothetical protein
VADRFKPRRLASGSFLTVDSYEEQQHQQRKMRIDFYHHSVFLRIGITLSLHELYLKIKVRI